MDEKNLRIAESAALIANYAGEVGFRFGGDRFESLSRMMEWSVACAIKFESIDYDDDVYQDLIKRFAGEQMLVKLLTRGENVRVNKTEHLDNPEKLLMPEYLSYATWLAMSGDRILPVVLSGGRLITKDRLIDLARETGLDDEDALHLCHRFVAGDDVSTGDAISTFPEPAKGDRVMYRGGLHKIISDGAFERNGVMLCTLSHLDIERDVPLTDLGIKLGCARYTNKDQSILTLGY